MTEETNTQTENHDTLRIPSKEEFHRHYGGTVYLTDFDTYYHITLPDYQGSFIARRIQSDFRNKKFQRSNL
ncbi:MAG: hypothetical protein KHZ96_12950 [Coprobacillus sp.]|jgi:hypothetical protein|nr:hypothetical protein [Coprobacillus sp.]DAP47873.1 MAG TPA: hypothetical protein [Caudoviricetes sp.]